MNVYREEDWPLLSLYYNSLEKWSILANKNGHLPYGAPYSPKVDPAVYAALQLITTHNTPPHRVSGLLVLCCAVSNCFTLLRLLVEYIRAPWYFSIETKNHTYQQAKKKYHKNFGRKKRYLCCCRSQPQQHISTSGQKRYGNVQLPRLVGSPSVHFRFQCRKFRARTVKWPPQPRESCRRTRFRGHALLARRARRSPSMTSLGRYPLHSGSARTRRLALATTTTTRRRRRMACDATTCAVPSISGDES